MRQIIIAALLLYFAMPVMGQEVDVDWGPELKRKRKQVVNRILGEDDRGFYVLGFDLRRSNVEMPIIEHYDKKFRLKYSASMDVLKSRNTYFNEFWYFNNKLYLFFSAYDRKQKVHTIYSQEVSKRNGKLLAKPELVVNLPVKNRFELGGLDFSASDDSSKALVFYTPDAPRGILERAENNRFSLKVFNKDMSSDWKKNVTIPYDANLVVVEKSSVDRSGNVYVLAKIYKNGRKERRQGQANYEYKVFAFYNKGETTKEYALELDGKFISDITFKINSRGDISCAGFHSDRNSLSVKGPFFFTIDGNSEKIVTQNVKDFDAKFLSRLIGQRRAKKGRELYRYYLDEIILRSDGGAVVMAEEYYAISHTYYTGTSRNPTTTYTYYYEDIIVINLKPNGDIQWNINIPKNQVSQTRAFSSYATAVANGKIHFVFNERIAKRAPVMLASVDTKGKLNMEQLFSNREIGAITRPQLCEQTSKNAMIIYSERNRRYKFGRITF